MGSELVLALGGVAALLLVLLCATLAMASTARRTRRALDASRDDVDALRQRLDAVTQELAAARQAPGSAAVAPRAEYLITGVSTGSIGGAGSTGGVSTGSTNGSGPTGGAGPTGEVGPTSGVAVLSFTLGEPLVKALALGYGLRRALSAESRNRIAFEMRREVKRARKQRRREVRVARRNVRAAERAALGEEGVA